MMATSHGWEQKPTLVRPVRTEPLGVVSWSGVLCFLRVLPRVLDGRVGMAMSCASVG